MSHFAVFERLTIEVSGYWSLSILLNFSVSEAFAWESLALGVIYFLVLLFSVLTSDILTLLTKEMLRF